MTRLSMIFINATAIAAILLFSLHPADGQKKNKPSDITALMISDIHLDPFADPGRVAQLNDAPASAWKNILEAAPSVNQAEQLDQLQQKCHSKGTDTTNTLFESALAAMRAQSSSAAFMTVSGDLMAHQFDCKYKTLLPQARERDYRAFTKKTLIYIQLRLHEAFPKIPIYIALGNNDSDCGDYRLDANSRFLEDEGEEISTLLLSEDRKSAQKEFASVGYYSAHLPASMHGARLLVLDDLFMSKDYTTCSGKQNDDGSSTQLQWLQKELENARAQNEKVWVMTHIPTGVNIHATVVKGKDICAGKKPSMFLSSDALTELLLRYSDVIPLVIFGHTHMDEWRLLQTEDDSGNTEKKIAAKLVPSITPVHGNHPSFTIAQIDPSTAELKDYRVIAASNLTGVKAAWHEEYDFNRSYHAQGFTANQVALLVGKFQKDTEANSAESRQYLDSVFTGGKIPLLQLFWQPYACAIGHSDPKAFSRCMCEQHP